MADIFDVIADGTRRDILRVLLERAAEAPGEISVSEIVGRLELSQPTVSKHLKVLRDAGLVHVREHGQHRFYRLDAAPLDEIEDWVLPFLSSGDDDAVLAEVLAPGAREFANNVGKVFADTSHVVSAAVERVTSWRS